MNSYKELARVQHGEDFYLVDADSLSPYANYLLTTEQQQINMEYEDEQRSSGGGSNFVAEEIVE